MCTAAERKFERVQISISCQGVLICFLWPGGVTGLNWMVWWCCILWVRQCKTLCHGSETSSGHIFRNEVVCSQQAFKHNIGRLSERPRWRLEMPRVLEWSKQGCCQVSKVALNFSFPGTVAILSTILMGSCAERFLKVAQSDTHLCWTPASLVNEECSASFLGATNRCILQLHAPSCLHSEAFVRRRCYSRDGTPAEFKWGSPEWSGARRLAGDSSFHGLIYFPHCKSVKY